MIQSGQKSRGFYYESFTILCFIWWWSLLSSIVYYAIYKEDYDAAASPAQTPVKTGNIQVTENGTNTVTVPDLYYGTYYVYELTEEGGIPIVSGSEGVRKAIADTVYQVTGSGPTAVVGESTPSVTFTNNKETVNVEVEKDWQDNNNAEGNRTCFSR